MTKVRIVTADPDQIDTDAMDFDVELLGVDDLTEPPPGYPSMIEFPPSHAIGEYEELDSLAKRLDADPPTHRVAFGISNPDLLSSSALEETVAIVQAQGVGADIVIDPVAVDVDS
jgi:hypothetical protein